MKRLVTFILVLSSFLIASDMTCRKALNIDELKKPYDIEFFILVDQTTYFEDIIKTNILENIQSAIQQGLRVNIYKFSQFSNGKYVDLVQSYYFDKVAQGNDEDELKKSQSKKLASCIDKQRIYNSKHIMQTVSEHFRPKSDKLQNSDILIALQTISERAIKNSSAKQKVVLLASDMLEHSTYISFYQNSKLKDINKKEEMAIVEDEDLLGDFGGAKVFVIGAGAIEASSNAVRDDKKLRKLRRFWEDYFNESKAELVEFGSPNLMRLMKENI